MLIVPKLPMFGKTDDKLPAPTPNHCASVAPYWSTAVVGFKVPRLFAYWSLPNARDGE
jgi:hypothetical protein